MDPAGYAGCAAAIHDIQLAGRLGEIRAPTIVLGGTRDVSTPFPDHGARIATAIPAAQTELIEAAHLAPVEAPAALASALIRFLLLPAGIEPAARMLYEAGLVNRRRVLGDEWVDQSLASRTPFNADFQEMITRIAWHEVWGRPGLDERTRRLLVIAITASLGCWEEFRLHVRVGLQRDGFTQDELKEVLIQTAIYAGVPAANTAFAEAAHIIKASGAS
jgi:3-oxoadipate enol-lactonase/4-carboxymuconolactone decarboxylase